MRTSQQLVGEEPGSKYDDVPKIVGTNEYEPLSLNRI